MLGSLESGAVRTATGSSRVLPTRKRELLGRTVPIRLPRRMIRQPPLALSSASMQLSPSGTAMLAGRFDGRVTGYRDMRVGRTGSLSGRRRTRTAGERSGPEMATDGDTPGHRSRDAASRTAKPTIRPRPAMPPHSDNTCQTSGAGLRRILVTAAASTRVLRQGIEGLRCWPSPGLGRD